MPARESKGNNGFALNRARVSLQNHVLPLSHIYPHSPRQLLTQEMASPNEASSPRQLLTQEMARRALLLACIDEALGIVEDIEHNEK
jgi:hypothetical protein